MRISETFFSVQGEGKLTGVPSVFIRTSGCNLRCRWCDTPYASWNPEGDDVSVEDILAEVNRHPTRYVVVTGGEPTIAAGMRELLQGLRDAGKHITIETAGTVMPTDLACDLASLSPKLANSTPSVEEAGRAGTIAMRRPAGNPKCSVPGRRRANTSLSLSCRPRRTFLRSKTCWPKQKSRQPLRTSSSCPKAASKPASTPWHLKSWNGAKYAVGAFAPGCTLTFLGTSGGREPLRGETEDWKTEDRRLEAGGRWGALEASSPHPTVGCPFDDLRRGWSTDFSRRIPQGGMWSKGSLYQSPNNNSSLSPHR